MKIMRKTFILILAMAMVLSMGTTAFAESNGSITINDAVPGETYTIYRIFDLESYSNEAKAYAYKVNSKWTSFINGSDIINKFVKVDDQGYVTWVENASAAEFAKLAKKYAEDNTIANNGRETAPAAAVGETYSTVSFTDLDLGYYLVDTTLGTLCSLNTTKPNVTIEEKNELPIVEKKVQEDSDGSWGESNHADIGQEVNFKITISAKPGAKNYVLHDKMSSGLDFNSDSVTVKIGDTTYDNTNYTLNTGNLQDDCTFELIFDQSLLNTITTDSAIEVSYTATVNENAVIGGYGNENGVALSYGDNGKTTWDKTTTYVYEVNIYKYTTTTEGEATVETPLAGAEFILYKNVSNTKYYAQITNGKITGWTETEADATKLVSAVDDFIYIKGLDADTYYLQETKAPNGYNILSGPVEIKIENNGVVTGATTIDNTTNVIRVLNNTGSELPSTGGMGTTIFYIVGGILVIGSIVLLVTRKKMFAKEN